MPGPSPGCCACGGSGGDTSIPINPSGCICAAVPASLSVSFNSEGYDAYWGQPLPDPFVNPDTHYKNSTLVWVPPGSSPSYRPDLIGGCWYSSTTFTSNEYNYAPGPTSPVRSVVLFQAAYQLKCTVNYWTLSFVDTRSSGAPEPIWRFSTTQTTPPNTCSPFLLACGFPPESTTSGCDYNWNVH